MGDCGLSLKEYYYTTLQEYYLKVEAFNDRFYRELDYIRRIQFDVRRGYDCKPQYKPKKLSDIIKLPIDERDVNVIRAITTVTQEHKDAMQKMGYNLVNPINNN